MNVIRVVAANAFCLALMGVVLSPAVMADEWNQKTEMTFSSPVEIPGVHLKGWGVLPAGTYVFKLLDSQSDRHIVQIFNKDETQVLATILAIPNYRMKATGKTVVTFWERPAGEPNALRAWFFPGENYGQQFVYPKSMAVELAKQINDVVLFTTAEIPLEVEQPIVTKDEPVVAQLKVAPVMAIKPTGEEVDLAQVVATPPAAEPAAEATVPADQPAAVPATLSADVPAALPATLPATSSTLPLIALLGLLALGGFYTLRVARQRLQ